MPGPRPPSRLFSTSIPRTAKSRYQRGGAGSGERDIMDIGSIPQFDGTALTRATHIKLDKQRDFLHLLRVEQMQFKNLESYSQRFLRPLPSQLIKVKHQHYQGETHPAARKVSITFSPTSLPFSSASTRRKFMLLVGNRWDAEKEQVKISCELFPRREMNEKWCSDTLDKLIKEAEDPTDPMSDIPLDPRPTQSRLRKSHKKPQITFKNSFPVEWLPQKVDRAVKSLGSRAGERVTLENTKSGVGSQGGLKASTEEDVSEVKSP